jgi:SAM-dependent methyltransferase
MHDTAYISGYCFSKAYTKNMTKSNLVYDIGGTNYNGSLKTFFDHMTYKCIDIVDNFGVDYIINPTEQYPFEENSVDVIISTSCFEHDPCFWITFKEMCRILKPDGYIYLSVPSSGGYHGYPGDNWRFYADAAQSLAFWSNKEYNGRVDSVVVEETFIIQPISNMCYLDNVSVYKKINQPTTEIVTPTNMKKKNGPLKRFCSSMDLICT